MADLALGGVVILAAGLGTRLRPLSEEAPKPLFPVGDRPLLAHLVDALRPISRATHASIGLNAFYRAADIDAYNRDGELIVVHEQELLGTAGGIRGVGDRLGGGALLVWNGDIIAPLDPLSLIEARARTKALATLVVKPRARGEGNVGMDASGRIVRLRSERVADEQRGGEFLGIHLVGSELRSALPERGCVVGDVYIPKMCAGGHLHAFCTDVPFRDIGTPGAYLEANFDWLRVTEQSHWIAPDAIVRGRATNCVIGAGAVVDGDVDRVVIWPGSTVKQDLRSAVVTPRFVVTI